MSVRKLLCETATWAIAARKHGIKFLLIEAIDYYRDTTHAGGPGHAPNTSVATSSVELALGTTKHTS